LVQDFEVGVGGEGFPEEAVVVVGAPSSGEVRVLLLVLLLKFLLLA
jgi:hypothetical protein